MFIETDCTITHEGRSFASGGAMVTDARIVAYPGTDGALNDWHGNRIGAYYVISSRPAVFFGYRSCFGDRYYYIRAKVNGREYSMRGFGVGMVAMGRAVKTSRG